MPTHLASFQDVCCLLLPMYCDAAVQCCITGPLDKSCNLVSDVCLTISDLTILLLLQG